MRHNSLCHSLTIRSIEVIYLHLTTEVDLEQSIIVISEMLKNRQYIYLFSILIASRAPKTPTTPSYFPENGIAST